MGLFDSFALPNVTMPTLNVPSFAELAAQKAAWETPPPPPTQEPPPSQLVSPPQLVLPAPPPPVADPAFNFTSTPPSAGFDFKVPEYVTSLVEQVTSLVTIPDPTDPLISEKPDSENFQLPTQLSPFFFLTGMFDDSSKPAGSHSSFPFLAVGAAALVLFFLVR